MDSQLVNVVLLGCAFHLIFFSFHTSVFIQQTVVHSIKTQPASDFKGDGYVSLCLTYVVFAVANWLAPSIIALTGLKFGMFLGSLTYVFYSASFIQPVTWLFYLAAALIGFGAGLLWTAQGSYLAESSSPETSGRNASVFWSMLQASLLFGNTFLYLAFEGQTVAISEQTRHIVYGVLTTVCSAGACVLLTLRRDPRQRLPSASLSSIVTSISTDTDRKQIADCQPVVTAWGQFVGAVRLAWSPEMILLATAFFFTGQLSAFFTGIYGTAIGATSEFGLDAKKFIGLAGIFIGIGEIVGGVVFGILGARLSKGLRRDAIFVLGYLVSIAAFSLVFVNLPPDSPLVEVAKLPAIIHPELWIAMLSSFLIGFGDACFNTQVYSLLMSAYSRNSVAAFALFKFVQSVGSAVAFLYSTTLNLHYQLYLLSLVASLATIGFCAVEWKLRSSATRDKLAKSESRQEIIKDERWAS